MWIYYDDKLWLCYFTHFFIYFTFTNFRWAKFTVFIGNYHYIIFFFFWWHFIDNLCSRLCAGRRTWQFYKRLGGTYSTSWKHWQCRLGVASSMNKADYVSAPHRNLPSTTRPMQPMFLLWLGLESDALEFTTLTHPMHQPVALDLGGNVFYVFVAHHPPLNTG